MKSGQKSSLLLCCKQKLFQEWQLINEQWPGAKNVHPDTLLKLFGLYTVAALVLFSNEFLYQPLWQLIEPSFSDSPEVYLYQDIFWLSFISLCYFLPGYYYAKHVLGISTREMGIKIKGFKSYLWIYLVGYALVLPCIIWSSSHEVFRQKYPLNFMAEASLHNFIIWEICYAIQFVALEFFFRGVMLFAFVRFFGVKAVMIMVIPYMMIHFYKPGLECFASIIAGFFLCWIALKTKSIVAGMLIHISVAWSMDLMALAQKGKLLSLLGG